MVAHRVESATAPTTASRQCMYSNARRRRVMRRLRLLRSISLSHSQKRVSQRVSYWVFIKEPCPVRGIQQMIVEETCEPSILISIVFSPCIPPVCCKYLESGDHSRKIPMEIQAKKIRGSRLHSTNVFPFGFQKQAATVRLQLRRHLGSYFHGV